jgi:hypothetical protein
MVRGFAVSAFFCTAFEFESRAQCWRACFQRRRVSRALNNRTLIAIIANYASTLRRDVQRLRARCFAELDALELRAETTQHALQRPRRIGVGIYTSECIANADA